MATWAVRAISVAHDSSPVRVFTTYAEIQTPIDRAPVLHSEHAHGPCLRAGSCRGYHAPEKISVGWESSFLNAACITGAKVLLKTIEKLRRKNRAVIVTGDFNAAPGQGSYEVLRDGTAAVSSEP